VAVTKCPKCDHSLEVDTPGKYKCPECKSLFTYEGKDIPRKAEKISDKKSSNVGCGTIIIIFLALGVIGAFISAVQEALTPASFTLNGRDERVASTPTTTLTFECVKIDSVKINDTLLRESEKEGLCDTGYEISLKDGKNEYKVQALGDDKTFQETVTISFDKKAYDKAQAEIAKKKKEAEAKKKAEEEAKLNALAKDYCSQRKSDIRKYPTLKIDGSSYIMEFNTAKQGRYLTQTDCKNRITQLLKLAEKDGTVISDSRMKDIIQKKHWIGMRDYQFVISVGNPDDINSSNYGSYKSDQYVYHKDSYGISAYYVYFDDGKLSSTQDF